MYKNIILESSQKRENGLFNINIWENEQNENYLTEMDNGKQEWASKILEFYLWYPPGYIVKPVLRGHLRNKEKVALTYKTRGSSIHNTFFYDRTRKDDL